MVALLFVAVVGLVYYITQPFVFKTLDSGEDIMANMGQNDTNAWQHTTSILDYVGNLWPIPLVIASILFLYVFVQRRDPESVYR